MMTQSQAAPLAAASRSIAAPYFNEFRIAVYVLVQYALGHDGC